MKHLFFSVAIFGIVLSSIIFYAKAPIEVTYNNGVFALKDEFVETEINELPVAVKKSVIKDFSGVKLSKAYVNEDNEYKLELKKESALAIVYTDTNGEWITK